VQQTATHCYTLQHTATHCSTLRHIAQHAAAHCDTQQHTATHCNALQRTATRCNALQRAATHCSILRVKTFSSYSSHLFKKTQTLNPQPCTHKKMPEFERDGRPPKLRDLLATATHCSTLQHTATRCNTLQHAATRCNTLQHTATQCNTLQLIVYLNSSGTVGGNSFQIFWLLGVRFGLVH